MKDMSVLDNLLVGRVEPHIYAFTTNTIPNYLKVGDTYRPVSVRLDEWKLHYPELEKKYEGILLSNVLHLFSNEVNQKLLVKLAAALHRNGILIMHDFFLSEDKSKRTIPSLYTLDWMLQGAFFHADAEDMKQWVGAAGLEFIKEVQYESIPTSIMVAKKD